MIGIFDSGAGGLCALAALKARLPHASYLYYADTAMLPFGEQPPEVIRARIARALSFFATKGADSVLLACGTASSYLTEECKEKFSFPVFDIIAPVAKELSRAERTALIATRATVLRGSFANALLKAADAPVYSLACGALVPMAERQTPPSRAAVARVLAPLFPLQPDTLVLGCTHFSLLGAQIASLFPHTRLIDAAAHAAEALCTQHPPHKKEPAALRFVATAAPMRFRRTAERILGTHLSPSLFQSC